MIPTYIFTKEHLQKAIKSCNNNIVALQISNFSETEKIALNQTYLRLKRIYRKRLIYLNRIDKAKLIEVSIEIVTK